jgi:uncharacterized protein YkwD/uncharacterized membrane protein required for colicin V production
MILVDLLLVGLLGYAVYAGSKRGLVLIGLELASFTLATVVALLGYHPLGGWIKHLSGSSTALGNVVGFALLWIMIEIASAILARYLVLRHVSRELHLSRANRVGGAVLGGIKALIITTLALIVFAGLPLSAATKRVVTESFLGGHLLSSSSRLQSWLAGGLGHDLGESLNFFTVTAEPESEQRIDLGYTTVGSVDPSDEDALLALLNQERTSRGLKPLTMNDKARVVARAYSADMFARGYFSHINPEGKSPFDRMRAGGVGFGAAGENLALAPTLKLAHDGLMNSPGHRANILGAQYRTVGIGIIDGGPYGLMVTQDFTD